MRERPPDLETPPETLVELLRRRATSDSDRRAFSFLRDGERDEMPLTYHELDRQARAVAGRLQGLGQKIEGERVLIVLPTGLEFLAAFFGCLYAGAVAVPVCPPRPSRPLDRLQAVAADTRAKLVLTEGALVSSLERRIDQTPDLAALHWTTIDQLLGGDPKDWGETALGGETIALLQYTSGSTSTARGVVVTHANLLHNSTLIERGFETGPNSRGVFWLPLYHDMGLIGGVLQTISSGGSSVLLSPFAFLQRPLRWLQAISRSRATISGGPNFAYDLCIRQSALEDVSDLDLSCWTVAFTGAEPIRAETLEQFSARFASQGFRPQAFYPCYGLAEATLFVTGGAKSDPPIVRSFDATALAVNRVTPSGSGENVRTLVGCGRPAPDQTLRVVDPETLTPCLPDQVGEIWLSGPSVAGGYWNRPGETSRTFEARTADSHEGAFLRTGDLGFLDDGELFITGRLKDLIIIRGCNHYPEDIERTAQESHPALRASTGAAFAVEVGGEERLVIVHELERGHRGQDPAEIHRAVGRAVAEHHDLQVYAMALLRVGSIPRTTSGKVRRSACREAYLSGDLGRSAGAWASSQ
jgi:acyl-CoA synthetase (AMP-forming)/AMP-acid ligase II